MHLKKAHARDSNVDEQWSVLCSALIESAVSVLGYERSYQPNWFRELFATLNSFLK